MSSLYARLDTGGSAPPPLSALLTDLFEAMQTPLDCRRVARAAAGTHRRHRVRGTMPPAPRTRNGSLFVVLADRPGTSGNAGKKRRTRRERRKAKRERSKQRARERRVLVAVKPATVGGAGATRGVAPSSAASVAAGSAAAAAVAEPTRATARLNCEGVTPVRGLFDRRRAPRGAQARRSMLQVAAALRGLRRAYVARLSGASGGGQHALPALGRLVRLPRTAPGVRGVVVYETRWVLGAVECRTGRIHRIVKRR